MEKSDREISGTHCIRTRPHYSCILTGVDLVSRLCGSCGGWWKSGGWRSRATSRWFSGSCGSRSFSCGATSGRWWSGSCGRPRWLWSCSCSWCFCGWTSRWLSSSCGGSWSSRPCGWTSGWVRVHPQGTVHGCQQGVGTLAAESPSEIIQVQGPDHPPSVVLVTHPLNLATRKGTVKYLI